MKQEVIRRGCRKLCRAHQGSVLVILIVCVTGLIGFAALSIDIGNVLQQRLKMQGATDITALAAIPEWASGKTQAATTTLGTAFATTNGLQSGEITIETGEWINTSRTFNPLAVQPASYAVGHVPAVRVRAGRTVSTPFARVIGNQAMHPAVESIAIAAQATAAAGQALPWAACGPATPTKCQTFDLKNGNDCSSPGNFGALALGGTGSSNYRDNIINGYQGTLSIGDVVSTEPGNMVGPTNQGLNTRLSGLPQYICTATSDPPNNARYAIIPVIANPPGLGSGRNSVTITAFWVFALNDSAGGGAVTAVFVYGFSGTSVDPNIPPSIGTLAGITLVK